MRYLILLALLLSTTGCYMRRDNSDASDGTPSGMNVYTDHLTGCQYLGHGNSLTPRLHSDGTMVCIGPEH